MSLPPPPPAHYVDYVALIAEHEAARARTVAAIAEGEPALRRLFELAQGDSGQCVRVARFLAGLYNGARFPFDLTTLRGLDTAVFEDVMLALRMDATACVKEVHRYFGDGIFEKTILKAR